MDLDQKNLDKLRSTLQNHKEVAVVYLFGSKARETDEANSDYDFAIYFDEKDVIRRSEALFTITSEISKILGTNKIDAHSLNDLQSPELKYQIITEGTVIFEREPFRLLIEPRILNEYFDFTYLLKKYGLTQA